MDARGPGGLTPCVCPMPGQAPAPPAGPGLHAVICSHDILAHMVSSLRGAGIAVPKRLASSALTTSPGRYTTALPLHQIRQDRTELGKSAFYALSCQLAQSPSVRFCSMRSSSSGTPSARILKILQKSPAVKSTPSQILAQREWRAVWKEDDSMKKAVMIAAVLGAGAGPGGLRQPGYNGDDNQTNSGTNAATASTTAPPLRAAIRYQW